MLVHTTADIHAQLGLIETSPKAHRLPLESLAKLQEYQAHDDVCQKALRLQVDTLKGCLRVHERCYETIVGLVRAKYEELLLEDYSEESEAALKGLIPGLVPYYYDVEIDSGSTAERAPVVPPIVNISENLLQLDGIAIPFYYEVELRVLKSLVTRAWAGDDYEEVLNKWNATDVTKTPVECSEKKVISIWITEVYEHESEVGECEGDEDEDGEEAENV
ncbi:hypothetical protein CALCODRAFT_481843 [Calocera cornea HHB12733]|uniref:Uncharacterized protein n=1 Tax=Calocera cornea HHB12733 TaxID=1353952 RepID=A0A165HBE2_9BASI|nr:hypothetical protein CALCODRAFT_481843 [Calocera cornea HHB12733]